jgi:hypothetical protein
MSGVIIGVNPLYMAVWCGVVWCMGQGGGLVSVQQQYLSFATLYEWQLGNTSSPTNGTPGRDKLHCVLDQGGLEQRRRIPKVVEAVPRDFRP